MVDKSVVGEDAFVVLRAKRGEAAIDTEPAANEGGHGANPNRPTSSALIPLEGAPSL